MSENLFPPERLVTRPSSSSRAEEVAGSPRVVTANRRQVVLRSEDLESLLDEDHRARALWEAVGQLDLSKFYEPIAARGSEPGRPATDPKILLTLWLYATSEGVASAREIARRCERDDGYRWICGGVSMNHHTLSDFRVDHGEALDDLMTQVLAVLMRHGVVKLQRVAHDGTRVRASAGAASFRRERSLKTCLEEARAQVERLRKEGEEGDAGRSARQRAAKERAARERRKRLKRALKELPKAREAKRTEKEKEQARVSTTDPEARVMKMGDGGYRPAYNIQLAADTQSRVIVGVNVTNAGTDMGQLEPMLEQVKRRTGEKPKEYLVDGGFTRLESIEHASEQGVVVYAPPAIPRKEGIDPHAPKEGDSPAVAEWRQRMGTPEAKTIYKERAATIETVNGDLRTWRGMGRLLVRGSDKVRCVGLWGAITYNLMRAFRLGVLT